MDMIIDFYDDKGALTGLEFEKVASEKEVSRPKLVKEAYAYPEIEKFPLDSKDNAVVSAYYIIEQKDKFASEEDFKEILKRAEEAIKVHDAEEDFKEFVKVAKKLSYKERKQLPESVFGIPELRKYPMPDEEHVRKAITFFNKAPEEYKPKLARRIMQKAKQFGVEVHSDHVLRYAGYTDLKKAASLLRNFRGYLVYEDEVLREGYFKVAEVLESYEDTFVSPEEIDKVAGAIEELDKIAEEKAGIKFSLKPYQLLFTKTAEEKEVMVKLCSVSVPVEKILEISDDKLKDLVGTTFSKENPEMAKDEIESLPKPEKEILENYLK